MYVQISIVVTSVFVVRCTVYVQTERMFNANIHHEIHSTLHPLLKKIIDQTRNDSSSFLTAVCVCENCNYTLLWCYLCNLFFFYYVEQPSRVFSVSSIATMSSKVPHYCICQPRSKPVELSKAKKYNICTYTNTNNKY